VWRSWANLARLPGLHRRSANENICSMANRSDKPRNEAIQAALYDSAILASMAVDEFEATYLGPERSEYLRVLSVNVAGLGGTLEIEPSGVAAAFAHRRIAIRFGNR
jgi:hypothetical protein